MATLAELVVKIGADISGFDSSVQGVNKKARALGHDLTAIGEGLTVGVTLPIVAMGTAALKAAGDFEQTEIAFETMLGSAERAATFLGELEEFAKRTPFEFTGLAEASSKLLAMGFEAEQLIPTMTAVGNAVSGVGGGSVGIDRVTTALGQMLAKGKVSAEEMNQLTEARIPAWKILAATLETDVAGAMDLVKDRAVDSGTAIAGLIEGMNERFGGLMEAQSQTILGQLNNLTDQLGVILREFGAGLKPAAQDVLSGIQPIVDELGKMSAGFAEAEPSTQRLVSGLGLAAAAAGPVLLALGQLVNLSASSWAGITSLGTGVAAIAPVFGKFGAALVVGAGYIWGIQKAAEAVVETFADWLGLDFAAATQRNTEDLRSFMVTMGLASDEATNLSEDYSDLTQGSEEYLASLRAANPELGEAKEKFSGTATAAVDLSKAKGMVDSFLKSVQDGARKAADRMQDLGEELRVINDNRIHELGEAINNEARPALTDLGADVVTLEPQVADLGKVFKTLGPQVKDIKKPVDDSRAALVQVSTIITDLSSGLADVILNGGSFIDVIKNIGKALIRSFIESGIQQAMSSVFGLLGDIGGLIGGGASAAGGVAGGVGGGAAGAAGGVGGGLLGGIGSIAGAVGSGVGAFFTAQNGQILEMIEDNTRRTAIAIGGETVTGSGGLGMRDALFKISENTDSMVPNLIDIKHTGFSSHTVLLDIREAIKTLANRPLEVTVNVGDTQFGDATASGLASSAALA